jgi:mycothiol synthase
VDIPEGLSQRPLQPTDAAAVTAVMAASELYDVGQVVIEEADIVAEWARPSFDVADQTIGVFDGGTLVGYSEWSGADRGDAAVHPDYRGRGIGTELARWMQQRARAGGATRVGMPVPAGSAGEKLMTDLGYHVRWHSWVLALPEGAEIVPQPLPEGYDVREATSADRRDVWTVVEDAFLEWSVRERSSFEDFSAGVFGRPGFEPWNLRVVTSPTGEIVGASHVVLDTNAGNAFIAKLAVRKDQRHRGLARALLVDSFTLARSHGARGSELSTDSRTGALALYEKVGMVVTSNWVNLAIDL